jgi:hypothetical protein
MWGNNYGNQFGQQYGQQFGQQFGQQAHVASQQGQVSAIRDDRIWADGEDAARSFYVAAGCSAVIWDLNRDTIYFKQTDFTGRPLPMMILDFTVRDQNQKTEYVTRQEFLQAINAILAPTKPAPAAPTETEVNNNA